MNREEWKAAVALFERARTLPADACERMLDEVSSEDPALGRRVRDMLRADAATHPLLDAERTEVSRLVSDRPGRHEGLRIGPYDLVQEIGRGGMGTVYLARRRDVDKRVALKLVTGGPASPERVERFLYERRVLAQLEHPDIARLMDAGVTADGTPWLAMEYVEGDPVDAWCDAHRLDIRSRLRLFVRICDAVAYAHRNLIVHRDLKPANILVTTDGEPRLVDFGIARLLQADGGDAARLTRTGPGPMTPEYASPEQVRDDPITTASDVYQLGVLLYRLLTDRLPYELRANTRYQIERAVLEAEPTRPSAVVSRSADRGAADSDGIGETRRTARIRLRRQLAGDLDTIVLKALQKEPERRYTTAGELADDLRRYLQRRPVRARPDTPGYRVRKFMRRNPIPVAAGALLFLLLGAFAVSMARQAERTARERDRAEEVSKFLTEVFRVSDPREADGDEVTARALLDRASERIEVELAGQPELQASMMVVMGRAYHGLGLFERAEALLRSALALRPDLQGSELPQVAAALEALGGVLLDQDAHEPAAAALGEALSLRERLHGPRSREVGVVLSDLAEVRSAQGDYDEAERLLRRALAIVRRRRGERHLDVTRARYALAVAIHRQGDLTQARRLFREVAERLRELPDTVDAGMADQLIDAAAILHYSREYDEAEPLYRQALDIRRRLYRSEPHPELASALNGLAQLLRDRGDYDAAEPVAREAVAMLQTLFPGGHTDVAVSMHTLAKVLHLRGENDEAGRTLEAAIAMNRRQLGPEHSRVVAGLLDLGQIRAAEGAHAAADSAHREALALARKLHGDDHVFVGRALAGLADTHRRGERYGEAVPLYVEAIDILRRTLSGDHPIVAHLALELAETLRAQNRCEEAVAHYETALSNPEHASGDQLAAEARAGLEACLATREP